MSLAIVYTRARQGVDAPLVTVETHLSGGLPRFAIVGLPEAAVKEARDRVRSAIINAHFSFPQSRITVNLAPADLPKDGGRFDLPIALGILAASEQIDARALAHYEFIGELALGGELRAVSGALPAAIHCARADRALILPDSNAEEAALSRHSRVYPAGHLLQITAHLFDRQRLERQAPSAACHRASYPDLREVRGQLQARRALEIAAAGSHNLLMYGPPGTGKTMLARRLPGILPPLSEEEALEVAAVWSVASAEPFDRRWQERPFRAPHHSASAPALVGGGSCPSPGEISLAHCGVLFLDELPEYPRQVLEVLREPLETGEITVSRARHKVHFPARFQLIAAMNPCPCGYFGDSARSCRCSPDQRRRYRDRISGPLLDRIDMHVPMPPLKRGELTGEDEGESSSAVRARVAAARARRQARGDGEATAAVQRQAQYALHRPDQRFLEDALQQLQLSARAYQRILKVARTIADLDAQEHIQRTHLAEAIGLRGLDRPG